MSKCVECDNFPFSALILLVGHQKGYLVSKKLDVGFVAGGDLTGA